MEALPQGTTSARLTIRLWRVDEAPVVSAAVTESLEHLRPWMAWADEPVTVEHYTEVVERGREHWRRGGDAMYGVFAGDVAVGGTGLHRRAGPDTLEIGYWIHVDHIGQGYATELAAALTDLAFTIDGIEHVEIHHDEANVRRTASVPRKLGFEHVATGPREPLAPAHSGVEWTWRVDRDAWPRRIWFAERYWLVKRSAAAVGPGPNRYDDSLGAVSADDGLMLRIRRDAQGWMCAEVVGDDETGYGVYEWTVASDLQRLDPQAVAGMFTWSDERGHHNREFDIEISAALGGAKFVVHPNETHSFDLPGIVPWRCSIDWRPDAVTFRAGDTSWTSATSPPPGGVHPRVNLWLFGGEPPQGTGTIELRITDFRFTPHA